MKRRIGTGKTVKKLEWRGANKVKVTYADLCSEEMDRKSYNQIIKEIRQ